MIKYLLFGLVICSLACSTPKSIHLKKLTALYPYGLIGDDYDILNEDDLASNTCAAEEQPFPSEVASYPYWQCFPVKNVDIVCEVTGYDKSQKTKLAILDLEVKGKAKNHHYLSRRAIVLETCNEFQNDLKRLTEKETYVCASGGFGGYDTDDFGKKEANWVFDKFKTKKGCSSYFVGGCDLQYQLKNGCKIPKLSKR
ncbi:MAG: hypothetical protein HY843_07825 [Bdellovibrio sp.]|nr:hypothetical protein [Bdellovibrio sp.]